MYPATVSPHAEYGEQLVYAEMQKLPEDWVVFHDSQEHYRNGNDYVNYEADFIVLVPHRGYAVIEVKDWPHIRIRDGVWQGKSSAEGSDWYTMGHKASPLNQAELACIKLRHSLENARVIPEQERFQPEHRCMAILTNAVPENFDEAIDEDKRIQTRTNSLPLDTLYVCGSEALQHGLRERIEGLFVKRGLQRNMTQEVMEGIVSYLAPTVCFRLDLRNYLGMMDAAAAPLAELLPLLEESTGGIRVDGCAGSGKTELAVREAARQAAASPRDGQQRLLMLCYNHNLADALHRRPELREHADVLTVSNFHDYCLHEILEPRGRADLWNDGAAGDRLTDAAMAYIRGVWTELPKYKAIFVDEGQDFRESWWQLIRSWLAPGGKLYIFADPQQQLYEHRGPIPELPTRIRLHRNLRNALQIARYGAAYLPENQRSDALNMQGESLFRPSPGTDDPELRAAYVRGFIEHIRTHSRFPVRNRDIVVLSPWRSNHHRSCLPYLADILDFAPEGETPEAMQQRHLRCLEPNSPRILADTIKAFKGLEAPFIILTDICAETESQGFTLDSFYVACTRAKLGLHIVPTLSGEELVNRHWPKGE